MKRLVVLGLIVAQPLAVAQPGEFASHKPVAPRAGPDEPAPPATLDPTLTPYADPSANPYVAPGGALSERSPALAPLDPTLTPDVDPWANPYVAPRAVPGERSPAPAALDPTLTPYADPSANPYLAPQGASAPAARFGAAPGGSPTPPAPPSAGPVKPPTPEGPVQPVGDAPVDPYATAPHATDAASPIPRRVGLADITAVQGLLAVQRLDGWLLFDRDGENPIAVRLVAPEGHPTRPWFYMIPARGNPVALVHSAELRSFDHLAGTKLTYQGYRDLDKQLRAMLKGVKSVAVEYSVKAAVPSVSRVDAGTLELIRAAGVQVKSSDTLVQFTKAIWGDPGRTAHYVAVHHVVELRKEALAFVVKQLQSGAPVTEYDVQQRIVHGMTMRGLVGSPPVVAAGANTADPYYVPSADKTATIKRGDLIVISLAAKLDKPEGVYAVQTWCAVADARVPEPIAKAFETASLARDQAMGLISDRMRKHRPVTGAEVDDVTRAFIKKAGFADRVMHRTGHSIDNDLQGGGADLDDFEVKDSRILTPGTGLTVGPGLYFPGQFGVRTEVSVYLAPGGPEVTTPAQDDVEALFPREGP